jgi:hypothetical protein
MSSMARRGFLRFMAAAPVALPVAAKEAAAGMGLQGLLGGASFGTNMPEAGGCNPIGYPQDACAPVNAADWLKQRLTELMSDESMERMRHDAKHAARYLDPDLAAMRSVSPSFAYGRQIDRHVDRRIAGERKWMERDAKHIARKLGL